MGETIRLFAYQQKRYILYIYKRFLNQTRDIFATRIFELWILGFSGACEDAGMPPEVNFLFRKFLLQQHTDPGSERLVMVGRVHGVVVKCGPVFFDVFCPSLLDFKGYTDI